MQRNIRSTREDKYMSINSKQKGLKEKFGKILLDMRDFIK